MTAAVTAPLTLAVSSSTGVMSLAVGRSAADGAAVVVPTERRHAEELSPRLQAVLAEAGVGLGDLERLAVDVGPGRFTGLRVGVATVRALAFALDLPVVGCSSLAVLAAGPAAQAEAAGAPVTAVIDARRSEVFQQCFVAGAPAGPAEVGPAADLAAAARGLVVGDGADRYRSDYDAVAGLTVIEGRNPVAATMLDLAGDDPGRPGVTIVPDYLRDPDAVPNIRTRPGAPAAATS
ncbi:MAG: tRNA (adenosine(37)-N6)-threonylcarbamoyltransferase complex dimerization subunit type 1 TsaB [Actinomycetota bacterium]